MKQKTNIPALEAKKTPNFPTWLPLAKRGRMSPANPSAQFSNPANFREKAHKEILSLGRVPCVPCVLAFAASSGHKRWRLKLRNLRLAAKGSERKLP
jgi:hypothetical protein